MFTRGFNFLGITFFGEFCGMGNKITINHVIGTGQEKMSAGVGGIGNLNNTMIPNFIHKYTF